MSIIRTYYKDMKMSINEKIRMEKVPEGTHARVTGYAPTGVSKCFALKTSSKVFTFVKKAPCIFTTITTVFNYRVGRQLRLSYFRTKSTHSFLKSGLLGTPRETAGSYRKKCWLPWGL